MPDRKPEFERETRDRMRVNMAIERVRLIAKFAFQMARRLNITDQLEARARARDFEVSPSCAPGGRAPGFSARRRARRASESTGRREGLTRRATTMSDTAATLKRMGELSNASVRPARAVREKSGTPPQRTAVS